MNALPITAFIALCVIYGTSYAFVSCILGNADEAALSVIRMIVACMSTWGYFLFRYLFEPGYKHTVRESIRTKATPIGKAFFCGIFSLGIPVTCITISQRSVPSTVVTLSQPIIPLVTMVIAHFTLRDEKISSQKLLLSLGDLFGAVLTMIPTFSSSQSASSSSSSSTIILDYLLLFISILCFGAGSIYLKVFLGEAELTLSCCFSSSGATLYTIVSSIIRVGLGTLFQQISKIDGRYVFCIILLGIIYSCIPTFLFMYVVRTLGAVKANLTNFGQIVIGTIAGVFFLNEMDKYTVNMKIMTWFGVLVIVCCLLFEFMIDSQKEKESKFKDNESLIKDGNFI